MNIIHARNRPNLSAGQGRCGIHPGSAGPQSLARSGHARQTVDRSGEQCRPPQAALEPGSHGRSEGSSVRHGRAGPLAPLSRRRAAGEGRTRARRPDDSQARPADIAR